MGVAMKELSLQVTDPSGQKEALINDLAPDSTVGELIEGLVPELGMPRLDVEGNPLVYQARLEREGRHLRNGERIGDAVEPNDRITLLPNVDAG